MISYSVVPEKISVGMREQEKVRNRLIAVAPTSVPHRPAMASRACFFSSENFCFCMKSFIKIENKINFYHGRNKHANIVKYTFVHPLFLSGYLFPKYCIIFFLNSCFFDLEIEIISVPILIKSPSRCPNI